MAAIYPPPREGYLTQIKARPRGGGMLDPTPARKGTAMYKHILVATDGSRLSARAIKAAARLAKTCNARLTALYAIAPYANPVYSEGASFGPRISRSRYKQAVEREARKALAAVEIEAQAAGVPYSPVLVTDSQPWNAIVRAARAKKCDLIVMASHGRRGISALLLGSETSKVLTHSKTAVLVCR
jgi:nucleotide-binding universal stress UspA family protein